jgi:hypothetical protein
MALIAGLERQRLTHDQPMTAARALAALPFSSLAFGWLINATSPKAAIAVVVAGNVVVVAVFVLLPAMRLIDAPGR